jgi:hypothetical protein
LSAIVLTCARSGLFDGLGFSAGLWWHGWTMAMVSLGILRWWGLAAVAGVGAGLSF